MQVWPEPVVVCPQRVASAASIVERELAVVRPGASAVRLLAEDILAEDIGTKRDQSGKRQRELAKGHAALPNRKIKLTKSTKQGCSMFLVKRSFQRSPANAGGKRVDVQPKWKARPDIPTKLDYR